MMTTKELAKANYLSLETNNERKTVALAKATIRSLRKNTCFLGYFNNGTIEKYTHGKISSLPDFVLPAYDPIIENLIRKMRNEPEVPELVQNVCKEIEKKGYFLFWN